MRRGIAQPMSCKALFCVMGAAVHKFWFPEKSSGAGQVALPRCLLMPQRQRQLHHTTPLHDFFQRLTQRTPSLGSVVHGGISENIWRIIWFPDREPVHNNMMHDVVARRFWLSLPSNSALLIASFFFVCWRASKSLAGLSPTSWFRSTAAHALCWSELSPQLDSWDKFWRRSLAKRPTLLCIPSPRTATQTKQRILHWRTHPEEGQHSPDVATACSRFAK